NVCRHPVPTRLTSDLAMNVLFGAFGKVEKEEPGAADQAKGTVRSIVPEEVGVLLDSARSVIVVPGYGMAVAQAQYAVSDLAKMRSEEHKTELQSRGHI